MFTNEENPVFIPTKEANGFDEIINSTAVNNFQSDSGALLNDKKLIRKRHHLCGIIS